MKRMMRDALRTRKRIFLSISVLILLILGTAVTTEAFELSYGVKSGAGLATFTGDTVPDYFERKFSFSVGGFLELAFFDLIRVQPELLVFHKGGRYDYLGVEGIYNLYYIDLPLLFKFYSLFPLPFRLHTYLGPYTGIKLVAKAKINGVTVDTLDVKDTDFGFLFGLGADIKRFTIDVRTSFSLDSISGVSAEDTKNNALTLMIGYRIR